MENPTRGNKNLWMDSDSDWDSLPGDDPSLKSNQDILTEQDLSNSRPLKVVVNHFDHITGTAQPTSNNVHHLVKENAAVSCEKKESNSDFHSVELKDETYRSYKNTSNQKKSSHIKKNNMEDLPYLKFKETGNKVPDRSNQPEPTNKKKRQYSVNRHVSWDDEDDEDDEDEDDEDEGTIDEKNNALVENYVATHSNIGYNSAVNSNEMQHSTTPSRSVKDNFFGEPITNMVNMQHSSIEIPRVLINNNAPAMTSMEERYFYEEAYYNCYTVAIHNSTARIPKLADSFEYHIRHWWQEFFGIFQIILDVLIIFILELTRFVCTVLRKMVVGFIHVVGDYFWKPFLSTLFNLFLQPLFVWLWNILTSVRRLVQPVVYIFTDLVQPFAVLLRAVRLCEYKTGDKTPLKNI